MCSPANSHLHLCPIPRSPSPPSISASPTSRFQRLVLHGISVTLAEDGEDTLTPQLEHPHLAQSPLQPEQEEQAQGAIFRKVKSW